MILISVVSSYQLLEAILLKTYKYKDQDIILLCSNFLTTNYPHYIDLGIYFKDIIVFSISIQCHNDNLEDKRDYFDNLLNKYNYSITEFEEIYCAAAHHSFGLYLYQKKIDFIFLEDGAGMLAKHQDLVNADYCINQNKTMLREKMGLYSGNSEYVKHIIADKNKLPKNFIHEKEIVHFSLSDTLANISQHDLETITSFFGFKNKIVIDTNSCVLFTEHFANLKIFTYQYQCKFYQFLVDYFFQDYNLIIKPHPDDITYYSLLFPHASIIKTKFPAEIFPYIITDHPKILAGISTTSIHNIDYLNSDVFSLDFNARNNIVVDSFHKYYIITKVIEQHKSSANINIFTMNIYRPLLQKMFNYNNISYNFSENINECEIAIIDHKCTYEEFSNFENKTIIFLFNPFECIEKDKIYKYIYPIKISKKILRDDFIFDNSDIEYIYIYDKSIPKEVEYFMHNIELKNSGIELKAETLTNEKLEIAILKGILEATEERLRKEIEINNSNIEGNRNHA